MKKLIIVVLCLQFSLPVFADAPKYYFHREPGIFSRTYITNGKDVNLGSGMFELYNLESIATTEASKKALEKYNCLKTTSHILYWGGLAAVLSTLLFRGDNNQSLRSGLILGGLITSFSGIFVSLSARTYHYQIINSENGVPVTEAEHESLKPRFEVASEESPSLGLSFTF